MLRKSKAFCSFAVNDLEAARKFYSQTLGLETADRPGRKGMLQLALAGGVKVLVYQKDDFVPAGYTVLNFPVDNLDKTVAALTERAVRFEVYPEGPFKTDARGITVGDEGPRMAWFRDPAGDILSAIEEHR